MSGATWVSADEVVISQHGGGDPRRLPVVGVRASWEMSNAGTFSCFARIDDLQAAGLGHDLSGRWLEWGGPPGRWGGVITGRPIEDGIVEIAAEGWASLLRGTVLTSWLELPAGEVGGLAKRALMSAEGQQFARLGIGTIDDGGDMLAVELGGQDVLEDVLPQLADDGGLEWLVDQDKVFTAGRHLSVDLSARVRLVENRHFSSEGSRIAGEFWSAPPAETLEIESAQRQQIRLTRLFDPDTSQRTLRIQGRKRLARGGGQEGWRPGQRPIAIGQRDTVRGTTTTSFTGQPWELQRPGVGLRSLAVPGYRHAPLPTIPMELSLLNVDGCWAACEIGNVVGLVMGSARFNGWFRVMVRAFDGDAGELIVSGEALADQRSAA